MKMNIRKLWALSCLTAAAVSTAGAAPALNGRFVLRPVTPGDVGLYSLPASTEYSGGLTTVGKGVAVYLEADINSAIAASNIVSVTWILTNQPLGSVATIGPSPLPANMPVYEPVDRSLYQVAQRALLRPDVEGQYTVIAQIVTTGSGSTNLSKTITAGTYMGAGTCALCHSGSQFAEDKYSDWMKTAHASIFTQGIDGAYGHYAQSCLQCHTVGYDVNTNAVNGGFDDMAKQTGWIFPTNFVPGNWAATPAQVQNVANIQCENCHGPGSQHAFLLGQTNKAGWPSISATLSSGDCNQCHDAPWRHAKGTEWYVSGHANTTRTPSGTANRAVCVRCHTSAGFLAFLEPSATTNVVYEPIGCQTCHEPHGQTTPTNNPHLLRILGSVKMPDGSVIANAGSGALCLQCHQVRNGSATNQMVAYPAGKYTWNGGSSMGVHDSSQGDLLLGVNAITYGKDIPSAAHRSAITNLCVGCHMQTVAYGDPAFLKAGGHTFNMTYTVVTNGVTNVVDKVDVCVQCHGQIASFDFPRGDLDGDGVIDGVQTEVKHLLNRLSAMMPGTNYVANGSYVADGLVKSSMSFKTNWPVKFLQAGYNWQFVNADGSLGLHNLPFAVGLLKASIADLSGDANNDGLPDWWQTLYYGSANSASAAPNAAPLGDNMPNWLKFALGVDPRVAGVAVPGGVVWANGSALGGSTNSIQIYTAAEVAIPTEVGKTYQLQAISMLDGTWQNVGAAIPGTGSSYSYVTPTRANAQQFYRVQVQ